MAHYRIILDATNLMGPWGAATDDIYMIAGFAIEQSEAIELTKLIQNNKHAIIGNSNIPIKWNIRDVFKHLSDIGADDLQVQLVQESNQIRSAMIDILKASSATVFCSLITAHSNDRETILSNRPGLISYSLSNLLQRIGYWARSQSGSSFKITLDWPEGSERGPFTKEYLNCWLPNGSSVSRNFCGPLCNLGFDPGVDFGVTLIDPLLQLCDLTVGAFRGFFNFALNGTIHDFGLDQFSKLIPRICTKSDGSIVGTGIVVSPRSDAACREITTALQSVQSRA